MMNLQGVLGHERSFPFACEVSCRVRAGLPGRYALLIFT
jgi:hypothetical protein